MKQLNGLVLLILVLSLAFGIQPAYADGASPWADILNPDGSIQWNKLTDLGVTNQPADWMKISVPGGMELKLDASYHRYQTPSGNLLVLPSPGTLFFMALHPAESGLANAQSYLGNGAAILSFLLGPELSVEQLAKITSKGYTSTEQFFKAIIAGKDNIWSIVNPTFLFEVLKMSYSSGFLVNALLLYVNGLANCANIPGGCQGLVKQACPGGNCGVPKAASCPLPTITQKHPALVIQKFAPEKPLVVGQDPAQRGADVEAHAVVPPVIFTWYEEKQVPASCQYNSSGTGGGCPGPGDQYDEVTNTEGVHVSWSSSMAGNSSWQTSGVKIECIQHVEVLPEPITGVRANASLDPESRYWIVTDLASKYYQAYVHHPNFDLLPGMGSAQSGCDGSKVCSAKATILGIPFADPGSFDLNLTVATAGTVFHYQGHDFPLTPPRVLFGKGLLQVYVTLVSLVPAGAP